MKTEFNLDDLHVLEIEARVPAINLNRNDLATIKRAMVAQLAEQLFNKTVVVNNSRGGTIFKLQVLIEGGPDA